MKLTPAARALLYFSRGVYVARAARARVRIASRDPEILSRESSLSAELPPPSTQPPARGKGAARRRSILFVTVDQQRFDALGVNGGKVARTPHLDQLARVGINYERAHVQNVVCMPSRSTMLTGQHPHTHGVIANGISLPDDGKSVAEVLRRAGYRTALLGKAHFDPHLDPLLRFHENRIAAEGLREPWHGFDHVELATHGPIGGHHYGAWLWREHPEEVGGFGAVLTGDGGGETGAPEVRDNPVARAHYHTDWIADRAIAWLRRLHASSEFFCWVSFPDPHHPFDPPAEEVERRVNFRELDLPAGHPGTAEAARKILAEKPSHWLDWFEGRFTNPEGGPTAFRPLSLTHDQVREVNARIHVENELIDEAVGRLIASLAELGRESDTDVFYTSDHGELQGDYGLLFKGPYHVDSLLRVPLVWRPAPSANVSTCAVAAPVGHVDLAPTFCRIAGLEPAGWMQGAPLPTTVEEAAERQRVITTFDSQFSNIGMHLSTIYRDGMICTTYGASSPEGGGHFPLYWRVWGRGTSIPRYDGTEGELYDVREDPHQWTNLWNDPSRRALRDDLAADLRAHMPPRGPRLPVVAPT